MVRIQRKRLDLNLKHAQLLRIDTCIIYNSTIVKKNTSIRQLNEFPFLRPCTEVKIYSFESLKVIYLDFGHLC